jgi:exodeoxyribonuclease VII small subunit
MVVAKTAPGGNGQFSLHHPGIMAKKTFEAALARLEQLTEELADGEQSLESSLKKFDEGIQLAAYCHQQLAEAKAKVELLLEKDGKLESSPFEGPERGT